MPETPWTSTLKRLRAAHQQPHSTPPTLAQLRETFAPAGIRYPIPPDVEVTAADIHGVPARWFYGPDSDGKRAVLYLHGGGYTLGSTESHAELIARIARATGIPVLAINYRLAPEHPHPAALDDARTAWHWLRHQHGLAPESIALAGDSAGAGLALALLIALRDAGDHQPAAAALMSPWTDLTLSGTSITERAPHDPLLSPDLLAHLAAGYLAGSDPTSPLVSPLFADLTGLPPLLIHVGTAEILYSDAQRLAAAALAAGVDVTLQVAEGAPHVYQSMLDVPEAIQATDTIAHFLRSRTAAGGLEVGGWNVQLDSRTPLGPRRAGGRRCSPSTPQSRSTYRDSTAVLRVIDTA